MTFKIGDYAWLNVNESPQMSVTNVRDDKVTCVWFDTIGAPHEMVFPEICLNEADLGEPSDTAAETYQTFTEPQPKKFGT